MKAFSLKTLLLVLVFCCLFVHDANADNINHVRNSETANTRNRNTRGVQSGTCGKNLTWTFDEDYSVLTISGTGDMDNWVYSTDYTEAYSMPWGAYMFLINKIVVEEGVTSIGDCAFYRCHAVDVSLPTSLKSIGSHAFRGSHLNNVTIPVDVVSIGECSFVECFYLSWFEVREGNSKYRSHDGLLYDHDLSTLVQFPWGKDVTSYTVESFVTTIGNNAFRSCASLTSITIPDSVLLIGNSAFSECSYLTSITLGDGLKSIGDYAFSDCASLTTITIPANVKTIGYGPFQGCNGLTSIEVADGNTNFASLYGVLFNKDISDLVQYPSGHESTSYTIPSCVTSIYDYAFSRSDKLTNVNILDGVKMIGNHCFDRCSGLVTVTISSSVESIGESAFNLCGNLRSVRIPGSVRSIGRKAFEMCNGLENLTISDGVKSIGESAFLCCTRLASISIPDSVESIGDDAFFQCVSLSSIEVSPGNSKFVSDDGVLFDHEHTILIEYPAKSNRSTYTIPSGVKTIGHGAFYNSKQLVSVNIPDSVISIEGDCFEGCSNLENVNIPSSVVSIGSSAFSMTHLFSISIPDSVKTIGKYAFSNCYSLDFVNIPDSVESFGDGMFYRSRLKRVFYQGSTDFPSISPAFVECNSLDVLCVSPDYRHLTFCGINVTSSLPICEEFRSNFSHCFKAKYIDGRFVQEKRRNATLFESRTNECVECECYNDSGAVSRSLCKSSDEVTRMCIDDKCVENPSNEQGWSVIIEVDGKAKQSDFNSDDVKKSVSALTGIKEPNLSVGFEVDEGGYIIRVFVYVKDETTAKTIASAIKAVDKGEGCAYGILCRNKSVFVNDLELPLSIAEDGRINRFVVALIMVMILIV